MTDPRDQELEELLRRDSRVSRAYRGLDDESIPPLLDARVKANARAALRKPRASWWLPVSAAAMIVVAVGLTLQVRRGGQTSAPAVAGVTLSAAPAAADATPATSNESQEAVLASAPAYDRAAPAPMLAESAPEPAAMAADQAAPSQPAEAPRVAAAPPLAVEARAADATATAMPQDAPAGSSERQESLAKMARKATVTGAAEAEADVAAIGAARAAGEVQTAADWLRKIADLRAAGRTAEAEAELARYKLAYPDPPTTEPPAAAP